ncbi:hypothetical protein BV20DRAFT_962430 [Pilatotrama ljubarskyi]|nr:hypothetical protein BV20DRAFT_962430 [Pilatotrama ljubarskyi]
MKLPYFQILALTFFRFVITARAAPAGSAFGARGEKGDSMIAGAAVKFPERVHETVNKLRTRNGLPVNVMQNTDESRPVIPVDNYQADVSRLTGGEQ